MEFEGGVISGLFKQAGPALERLRWINRVERLAEAFGAVSPMSVFKRRRFPAEIILLCVCWYCRYGISYWDLECSAWNGVGAQIADGGVLAGRP